MENYLRIALKSPGIGATSALSVYLQIFHIHEEHAKEMHSIHLPKTDQSVVHDEAEMRISMVVIYIYSCTYMMSIRILLANVV